MPITELVFPTYKLESESLDALRSKRSEIFSHFLGAEGLQSFVTGPILEENGTSVDAASEKTVLVFGMFPFSLKTLPVSHQS
jgi:hypothetical protein